MNSNSKEQTTSSSLQTKQLQCFLKLRLLLVLQHLMPLVMFSEKQWAQCMAIKMSGMQGCL